jgi:GAF domain-containing protein
MTAWRNDDENTALKIILEGTAQTIGEDFFHSLVWHLAAAIQVPYAFVAEFTETKLRVRTLAYWAKDRLQPNVEFNLAGTPCEDVVRSVLCHHPNSVRQKFPEDRPLVAMEIEGYLGVPLLDRDQNVLGHLAVFDTKPMPPEPRRLFVFRIFAARAAAESQRLRIERMLHDSEKRFRRHSKRGRAELAGVGASPQG